VDKTKGDINIPKLSSLITDVRAHRSSLVTTLSSFSLTFLVVASVLKQS